MYFIIRAPKDYNGEDAVLFEEFNGGFDLASLLTWVDQYPVKVPVYQSARELCSTISIVISNEPPTTFYCGVAATRRAAFMRRFKCYCVSRVGDITYVMRTQLVDGYLEDVWDTKRRVSGANPEAVLLEE